MEMTIMEMTIMEMTNMEMTITIETASRLSEEPLKSLVYSQLDGLADLPLEKVQVTTPLTERVATLAQLSGLQIIGYTQQNVAYYMFMRDKQTVKTVCTYRKAKVFAEGVAIGRELK